MKALEHSKYIIISVTKMISINKFYNLKFGTIIANVIKIIYYFNSHILHHNKHMWI